VIDNVVWSDSWLSIAGVGCGLTGVGAGEEQVGVEKTSRLRSKDTGGYRSDRSDRWVPV
jgi:hypothetical protein